MLLLLLVLVGDRWCLLRLLKRLLVLLVRELSKRCLPVQLVFLEAFDVQEEQQILRITNENVNAGDHPAEDKRALGLIVAVIIEEPSLIVRITCESLRRDINHRDGKAYRGEDKEHLNTAGPLHHAIGHYVIRLLRVVKSQIHGGVNNGKQKSYATNCDCGDHDIFQILVIVLSPLLINVVYQISASERKKNYLYRDPGKEV